MGNSPNKGVSVSAEGGSGLRRLRHSISVLSDFQHVTRNAEPSRVGHRADQ
jgi:hypothetical protein